MTFQNNRRSSFREIVITTSDVNVVFGRMRLASIPEYLKYISNHLKRIYLKFIESLLKSYTYLKNMCNNDGGEGVIYSGGLCRSTTLLQSSPEGDISPPPSPGFFNKDMIGPFVWMWTGWKMGTNGPTHYFPLQREVQREPHPRNGRFSMQSTGTKKGPCHAHGGQILLSFISAKFNY